MTLEQKHKQLKTMKKEARKAAIRGRYSWGDHHRRQQISDLKKEIRNMQSSPNSEPSVQRSASAYVEPRTNKTDEHA